MERHIDFCISLNWMYLSTFKCIHDVLTHLSGHCRDTVTHVLIVVLKLLNTELNVLYLSVSL